MTRCLVTDGRRLCGEWASFDVIRRALVRQVLQAVEARVELVQLRERHLPAVSLAALARDVVAATRGTTTRVFINERLDVALLSGADGVHLRGDSMPAEAVRRIVPPRFLITRSVHSAGEALRAGAVDYVIAGTVFPTASKAAGALLLGLEGLAAVTRAARVPVLAIGGITPERVEAIQQAGAAGFAGIGLFMELSGRM